MIMIMILLLLLIILLVLNVTGQNALRGSLRGEKEAAGGNSNPNRRRSKPKRQYDGKDPNLGNLLLLSLSSLSLSLISS